jgi:hypothetical protein
MANKAMTADHEAGAYVEPEKVNLEERFGRFGGLWSPKIMGTVNDYDLKLVKVRGEFVWHQHDDTGTVQGYNANFKSYLD